MRDKSGYGFPIGGVAAMDLDEGVISPGGIGFDINCGMRLVTTNLTQKDIQPHLKQLVDELFKKVPAGVGASGFVKLNANEFKKLVTDGSEWCIEKGYGWKEDLKFTEEYGRIDGVDISKISDKAIKRGLSQIGTLGSGNHYLEIQVAKPEFVFDKKIAEVYGINQDNQIVIMFHCGSRGFGHQVASDYLEKFLSVMDRKYKIKILDRELACAPFNSPEGQDYFAAMKGALNMSFANRQVILHRIREVFSSVLKKPAEDLGLNMVYDVAHNTAKIEEHMLDGKKKKLLVHRKGATRAFGPGREEIVKEYRDVGQPIIIGGSMETGSYLLAGTEGAMEQTFGSTCFSGDTKVLTDKGLFPIKELYERLNKFETFYVLSINEKTLKAEWKRITDTFKRRAPLLRISVSQKGRKHTNALDLTPDHKVVSFNGLEITGISVADLINNSGMVCVLDRIPGLEEKNAKELGYLAGALFSDGYLRFDGRHGQVTFTQKPDPTKIEFIKQVTSNFEYLFGVPLVDKGPKISSGSIRGKIIQGSSNDYTCAQQLPAKILLDLRSNLSEWILNADDQTLLGYLAGLIDGDGSFNPKNRCLHIFSGKKDVIESIILACLRLGVVPYVSKNRDNCLNIHITDKQDLLLQNTKRVKGHLNKRIYGTKLFSARQLFNFRDFVWPFKQKAEANKLMSSVEIKKYINEFSPHEKKALLGIINSDVRMQRVKKVADLGEDDIYNITVEDNHNYVVFTSHFTPVIVKNCHGSGRTMSRTKAKHMFNGEQLQKDMEKRGIYVKTVTFSGLAEEAGPAYKDIDDVIDAVDSAGISKKVVRFVPIGNVKG